MEWPTRAPFFILSSEREGLPPPGKQRFYLKPTLHWALWCIATTILVFAPMWMLYLPWWVDALLVLVAMMVLLANFSAHSAKLEEYRRISQGVFKVNSPLYFAVQRKVTYYPVIIATVLAFCATLAYNCSLAEQDNPAEQVLTLSQLSLLLSACVAAYLYLVPLFFKKDMHQPWYELAVESAPFEHLKRFLETQEKIEFRYHPWAWRPRDDLAKQTYRRALRSTFFRSKGQAYVMPIPGVFLFMFFAPVSLSYLCLIAVLIAGNIVHTEDGAHLASLIIASLLWAGTSFSWYQYTGLIMLRDRVQDKPIKFTYPDKHFLTEEQFSNQVAHIFEGRGGFVAGLIVFSLVPFFWSAIDVLFA